MEWIIENKESIIALIAALYGVSKVIVNLTPSEKDNDLLAKVAGLVDRLVDLFIPNLKKGGGTVTKNIFMKKK